MNIFKDASTLVLIIGILAFLVAVITEYTKKLSFLDKVPTALQVIVLSLILCPAALLAMASYYGLPIEWYMVFASFIAAFIVALVCMDGWERITGLAGRFVKKDIGDGGE